MEKSILDQRQLSFISLLGDFPKPAALNMKILKEEKFSDYTRKLIAYTTEDQERMEAFLTHTSRKNSSR